ncbi:MAG: hypothetical protein ACE5FU_09625, partial [Nitrospinota bacterium]
MLFKYVSVSWAVKALASPRFTIFNFIFLLLNTLLIKPLEVESLGFISLAVSLMFVNLLFRFIKKKGFSTFPLGLFHLALLIFIGALGAGSLFYFYGYMELAEGQKDG